MDQYARLEQILKEDTSSYSMKDIMKIFAISFDGYEKTSKTVAAIKQKLTKAEWNSFVNGITMTFFLSLHASKMPYEDAIKLADTEGVVGLAVVSTEPK